MIVETNIDEVNMAWRRSKPDGNAAGERFELSSEGLSNEEQHLEPRHDKEWFRQPNTRECSFVFSGSSCSTTQPQSLSKGGFFSHARCVEDWSDVAALLFGSSLSNDAIEGSRSKSRKQSSRLFRKTNHKTRPDMPVSLLFLVS